MRYGERIGKDNLKDEALERLVTGYPDHGFVIDRTECKELFKNIRSPNENEKNLADHLFNIINENTLKTPPLILNLTEWYLTEKTKRETSKNGQRNNEKTGSSEKRKLSKELSINKKNDAKSIDNNNIEEK